MTAAPLTALRDLTSLFDLSVLGVGLGEGAATVSLVAFCFLAATGVASSVAFLFSGFLLSDLGVEALDFLLAGDSVALENRD